MLNLSDETVNYSDETALFPFTAYGVFDIALLDYRESGACGSETNKGDKEYDMAVGQIVASTNPEIKVGETFGFFFQTGGNGMSVKSRPFKIKAIRAFLAAAHGVNVKDVPLKDWPAKRQECLDADYSDGADKVRLRTSEGNAREDGSHYRDDVWSAIA